MARPRSVREQVGLDPDPEEQAAIDEQRAATQADTQAQADRPEWLPEGFQSPEELAQAHQETERRYKEAERERGRLAQELGDARDMLAENALAQQQQPQYQPQPQYQQPNPFIDQYQQALDTGDAAALFQLNATLANAAAQSALEQAYQQQQPVWQGYHSQQAELTNEVAIREVSGRYGDNWTPDFEAQVGDMLRDHPQLVPDNADFQTTVNGLSLAAELVHAKSLAEAQGQQAAHDEAQRQRKLMAQSATGTAGRVAGGADPRDSLIEQMKAQRTSGYANRG
jgi:hypothetical protein